MSRRGAGIVRQLSQSTSESARVETPELQLIETPALGGIVIETARALIRAGMKPPEVSSLLAHAAAHLAQQGPVDKRLTRDEWLALCAVLWDGPDGSERVTSPGGDA